MAHFAEIGLNSIVQRVIVVNNIELLDKNGVEQESIGQEFCRNLLGGTWVQASYNRQFRKNFPGTGYTYDLTRDAFIPPKPYQSWVLEEQTCLWIAPVPVPGDDKLYRWDEDLTAWIEITTQIGV
jgi:hypothetical protein